MTTKPPFIPLLSLVLLVAAGGGSLFALSTSNRQPNALRDTPASSESSASESSSPEFTAPDKSTPAVPQPEASATPEPDAGGAIAASPSDRTQPETAGDRAQPQPAQSTPAQPSRAGYDTTIIPGERVGPITRNTTRQDLVALFGEQQLVDMAVPVGEGFTEPGVEVALDDGHTFSLIWTDETRSGVREVRDLGPAWQTPEGIRVGMPLSELRPLAGEFDFLGFGWDYGGTILLNTSQLEDYADSLTLRMTVDYDQVDAAAQPYASLRGDSIYASAGSGIEDLNPYVYEMIVTLTPN